MVMPSMVVFSEGLRVLTLPLSLDVQFSGAIIMVSFFESFWILVGLQWSPWLCVVRMMSAFSVVPIVFPYFLRSM